MDRVGRRGLGPCTATGSPVIKYPQERVVGGRLYTGQEDKAWLMTMSTEYLRKRQLSPVPWEKQLLQPEAGAETRRPITESYVSL